MRSVSRLDHSQTSPAAIEQCPLSSCPAFVPGIHVFAGPEQERRGWPGRSPAMTGRSTFARSKIRADRCDAGSRAPQSLIGVEISDGALGRNADRRAALVVAAHAGIGIDIGLLARRALIAPSLLQ